MYAFKPTTTGLPLTVAVVAWLPWLLATTSVLPVALGAGSCIAMVMTSSFPLISAFMVFCAPTVRPRASAVVRVLPAVGCWFDGLWSSHRDNRTHPANLSSGLVDDCAS